MTLYKFVFLEMMHVLHVVVDIHTCILGFLGYYRSTTTSVIEFEI